MKLKLPKPYISYSQMSTWGYNRGQYVDRYIFNVPTLETPFLLFGKQFGKWLEDGVWPDAHPDIQKILKKIKRFSHAEYELKESFTTERGDFDFLGFIDSFDPRLYKIREYKTGYKEWNQKRANEHKQTQIYAGIILKKTGRLPAVWIDWIPTHLDNGICVPQGKIHTFRVKVTPQSALKALRELQDTAIEIHEWYADYLGGKIKLEDDRDPNAPEPAVPDWMLK